MIPVELEQLHRTHWNTFSANYNLSHKDGCGQYTEHWVTFANSNGYPLVKNLKKNPGQTQYNGHAIDAFLYADGAGNPEGKYAAVDIIGGAEGPNPVINWGVDIPRYTSADIWNGSTPQPGFPSYESLGGDALCRELVGIPLTADYAQAGKPLNDGSVVWTNRTVYDALYFCIVDKLEARSAYTKSANKHRPEWRKELGLE